MKTTQALRQQARDNQNATRLCPSGCGHLQAQHFELDRSDPAYQPLHFHCRECECVRVIA